MLDYAQARRIMVDSQLRTFDISDIALLRAMAEVARERFVPPERRGLAYSDQAVPLAPAAGGEMRWMLAPMVAGRLIQALEVAPGTRVLDVACGFGYTSAVLMRLGGVVTGLEDEEALAAKARGMLEEEAAGDGVGRISGIVCGPLDRGVAAQAPFAAILINGAVEVEPRRLLEQLAEGGRLACILGRGRAARATLFVRAGNGFGARSLFDAAAPLLPAFRKAPAFTF